MLSILNLFLHLSVLYTSVYGAAVGRRGYTQPYYPWTYQNVQTESYNNPPTLMSGSLVGPSPGGGSISEGYSYSTTFSVSPTFDWTIGASSVEGGSGGIFFGVSVSWSWTHGASTSVSLNCPANIECGLTASGQYVRVTGEIMTSPCFGDGGDDLYTAPQDCTPATESDLEDWYEMNWFSSRDGLPGQPYNTWSAFEAELPVIDSHASLVDGQDAAIVDWNMCYVKNPKSTGDTGSMTECPI